MLQHLSVDIMRLKLLITLNTLQKYEKTSEA